MRATISLIPYVGGCALIVGGWAAAQQPIPLEQLPEGLRAKVQVATQEPQAETSAEAKPAADDAAAKLAKKRLTMFKKLSFDRRPSSILKAWAEPELKPYDPSEEEAEQQRGDQAGGGADGATEPNVAEVAPQVVTVDGMSREDIERMLVEQFGKPGGGAAPAPGAAAEPGKAKAKTDLEQKQLQREMEMLQRDVTLGRWHKVREFLELLPEDGRKDAYETLLKKLPTPPKNPAAQRVPAKLRETNRFEFEDALALAAVAPDGFDNKQIKLLVPLVKRALDSGSVSEELVRVLQLEVGREAADQRLNRRQAALLLAGLGQEIELGVFLPTATEAEKDNDREALNLLARHALAKYAKEQRREWLETAWQVTQAALAKGDVEKEEKQEALRRAVELAPKVREDLGPAWLEESFTTRPERGMEIIATIGGQVAKGFEQKARDTKYRADGLLLQKSAVEALLKSAPELAQQWRPTLGLLAAGWIVEASYSYTNSKTTSFGPMMERDAFGNIFWSSRRRGGGGQILAVEPADLLEAQPGKEWSALLDDALRPHFDAVSAQLWLKVNEYEKAFPFIEQLAAVNARKAKDLAHEFLRVWMRNNNPNTNRRTNSYMFIYGFDSRADGIPLTRSKQERNLDELSQYVERLRALPIGGVDQKILGEAFVAAHSRAEVYRLETIERVFGDVSELDPVLLGELLGKMRTNLATIWREPAVQEEQKTRRTQREMLLEVAEGYDTALQIAQDARSRLGDHWSLLCAVATILHDRNNFSRELKRDSDFSDVRKQAFGLFAMAADHYVSTRRWVGAGRGDRYAVHVVVLRRTRCFGSRCDRRRDGVGEESARTDSRNRSPSCRKAAANVIRRCLPTCCSIACRR